ncbi:hypothetical protein [Ferruginibacter albus]|uniref:hypothetical protein n=1 Tax=Ferruginibacter albus TaxID=2875540 RepID=UPI001CC79AC2|nr:hypothetical protein [Ferruginibacter albus]UAY52027.1 hypothetical protein K9M53_15715 [Ferruginibacter albus]
MPKYITHIEMENGNLEDFSSLNKELLRSSFKNENINADKLKHPSKIVLSKSGNVSLQEINAEILKAIGRTGKKFSFYVVRDKNSSLN